LMSQQARSPGFRYVTTTSLPLQERGRREA
jgi:hypothetical protein